MENTYKQQRENRKYVLTHTT